ncbi:hypothetical protein LCGC14_2725370, partial [marine sediment metagenome]
VDADRKVVMWAYPSTSGDGTPDRLLIYNYEENRFSEAPYAVHCLGSILSPAITINGMNSYFSFIKDANIPFDSKFWLGGAPMNGVITDANKKVAAFNSTALDATIETGEIDFEDVFFIKQLRPIIEQALGTVTAKLKTRLDDNDNYASVSVATGANGLADLRATGRYHKLRLELTGEHQGLRGCKFDAVQTGGR